MIVVFIGGKFYYDNWPAEPTVQISPFLWYMMVGGLVIPFAGVFTFLIGNYYSVQEYPIGFFLDLLLTRRVGNTQNDNGEQSLSFKPIHFGMLSEADKGAKNIARKSLSDFIEMHSTNCLCKYFYVFQHPVLIILSISYTLTILAFAICFVLHVGTNNQMADSTGWVVFFVLGITLICLANILVLLVGGVWLIIFWICCFCCHKISKKLCLLFFCVQ